MSNKHTPGPWEIAAPTMAGNDRPVIEAYGFGSIAVISLNGAPKHQDRLPAESPYHQPQPVTIEANAKLIAAAPALLAALLEAETVLQGAAMELRSVGSARAAHEYEQKASEIRAVISKATR